MVALKLREVKNLSKLPPPPPPKVSLYILRKIDSHLTGLPQGGHLPAYQPECERTSWKL